MTLRNIFVNLHVDSISILSYFIYFINNMKKLLLAAALTMVSAPAWADGDAATITSSPSPAIAGQPVTVTIKTTAWSGDVYVYSWVVIDEVIYSF